MPTKIDLERALEEFARLEKEQDVQVVHENERHVQVILAQGVNVQKWTNSALANTIKYVRFEALVEHGVKSKDIDNKTTCDVIIIKLVGKPHQAAVTEITGQLWEYGRVECNRVFDVGGGRDVFTVDTFNNPSYREPDVTFSTGGPNDVPTIVVELEHNHRSLKKLDSWCRGFFHTDGVQQVCGIKMFDPNANHEVAALAVHYGYDSTSQQVTIIDAISFGQRRVVRQGVPDDIWTRIRFLTNPTLAEIKSDTNPWTTAGEIGILTVPFGVCTYNSPVQLTVGEDLKLDLFLILRKFCIALGL